MKTEQETTLGDASQEHETARLRRALDTIDRINAYQANPMFHPLTCGTNSRHGSLHALWNGEAVILKCPDCSYEQTFIPRFLVGDQD